ncbi:hypothetical protein T492DRAFT_146986 [Pavlovales sp. CCMP2436]|nr:hypothetical protein T492DRAFT_146986 [Pavlovales sp. CCMP2436]
MYSCQDQARVLLSASRPQPHGSTVGTGAARASAAAKGGMSNHVCTTSSGSHVGSNSICTACTSHTPSLTTGARIAMSVTRIAPSVSSSVAHTSTRVSTSAMCPALNARLTSACAEQVEGMPR